MLKGRSAERGGGHIMSLTWGKCLAENEMLRAQIAVIPEEIARQTKALRDDLDYLFF